MKILMLDDTASRAEEFKTLTGLTVTLVSNRVDFIKALDTTIFDLIMLDHDLGLMDFNGVDAIGILADNKRLIDQTVIVHSMNNIGAANMLSRIKYASNINVSVIPGAWKKAKYNNTAGLNFKP